MSVLKNRVDNIAQGIQKAMGTANEKLGLAIMEGLMLRVFDQFTDQQLYEAIVANRNLWGENWGAFEKYRENVMEIIQNPKYSQYADRLTVENILEWLRQPDGKPDFASIIVNTPGGPAWLECQIGCLLSGASVPMEVKGIGSGTPAD